MRVIEAWAGELRQGRVQAASRLFALPSRVEISAGSQIYTLRRRADVVAFNSVLPCGARLLRADRRGRFVDALFVLANRADSPCDAPGATARVAFIVRGGLITDWYRTPSEAGDSASPPPRSTPTPSTPAPSTPAPTTPPAPSAAPPI